MSEPFNYKASFKAPKCVYLKYFCEKPASDWTLKKFMKYFKQLNKDPGALYIKQLLNVKAHSKNIPTAVLIEINDQLEKLKNGSPTQPLIKKVENYYNINTVQGGLIVNNNQEPVKKKQKTRHDEDKEIEHGFVKKWKSFLADAEASNAKLHKYNPEKNGVLRYASKLSKRSSICDSNDKIKRFIEPLLYLSPDLEENVENISNLTEYKSECRFIKKIVLAVSNMHKRQPSMTYSESVFNYILLFPCLSATSSFLNDATTVEPYFTPGEEPLRAMADQLTMINLKVDTRKQYKSDGVIRLSKMNDLEGMFALLAMAKSIADHFSHASVETFAKLKLYYVQASDKYLRLWSIQYISNGIYKYNREDKLKIRVDEPDQMVKELVDFFNVVKVSLIKTFDLMLQLKLEEEEGKDANSQQTLLSDIICPKIFRLTYNIHGKGFKSNTINSSPESNH